MLFTVTKQPYAEIYTHINLAELLVRKYEQNAKAEDDVDFEEDGKVKSRHDSRRKTVSLHLIFILFAHQ